MDGQSQFLPSLFSAAGRPGCTDATEVQAMPRVLKTKESGFQSGSSVGSPERSHISLLAVFCLYFLFFKASGKLHLQVASPTS